MSDKIKEYLFTVISWLFIYFFPTAKFILTVGFLVICDTATGIAAAKKRGEKILSSRMRDVVPKFVAYGCGILVAHVLELQFFPDFPSLKLVAGLIAYIELKSIDENIHDITGFSLFKTVIQRLKK